MFIYNTNNNSNTESIQISEKTDQERINAVVNTKPRKIGATKQKRKITQLNKQYLQRLGLKVEDARAQSPEFIKHKSKVQIK